jgi:hypothetical protein
MYICSKRLQCDEIKINPNDHPGSRWKNIVKATPESAHLLIVLGYCDSEKDAYMHFIGINLILGVVYDASESTVAYKLNLRALSSLALKRPTEAYAITFLNTTTVTMFNHL